MLIYVDDIQNLINIRIPTIKFLYSHKHLTINFLLRHTTHIHKGTSDNTAMRTNV